MLWLGRVVQICAFALVLAQALSLAQVLALPQAPAAQASIRNANFRAYLLQQDDLGNNLRKECGRAPLIQNLNVSYGVVDGLPDTLAVVEAATCAMGNGGADIVEVFREGPEGKLQSLPIDETGAPADLYAGERRTPRLQILGGALTRWFVRDDKSDNLGRGKSGVRREIRYRWQGDRFVIADIKDVPSSP
jgi:hypothetical protein